MASTSSTSSLVVEVKETKEELAQREMTQGLRKLKIELAEKYHNLLLTGPATICLFAMPIIILLCIYLSAWALTNRLEQVDCRVAGCWQSDPSLDYYCHFVYNSSTSAEISQLITNGETFPTATVSVVDVDGGVVGILTNFTQVIIYQHVGKLKVASADATTRTSGKNGEARYWVDSAFAPASVFNDHYASKTKCLSDPQHRSNIYFDTVDLDDTLLTYTQPMWILTGFEIFFVLVICYQAYQYWYDLDIGRYNLKLKYAAATIA